MQHAVSYVKTCRSICESLRIDISQDITRLQLMYVLRMSVSMCTHAFSRTRLMIAQPTT